MPRKNKKQKAIEFLNSIGINAPAILKTLKKNDEMLWNIDTDLGKLNILSKVPSATIHKFKVSKTLKKKMRYNKLLGEKCKPHRPSTASDPAVAAARDKRRTLQVAGCKLFVKTHGLNPKSGRILWETLPEKEKKFYARLTPQILAYVREIFPRKLSWLKM